MYMCSAQQTPQKLVLKIIKEKVSTIQSILYQFGYARVNHGSHMSKSQCVSKYFHTSLYTYRLLPSTGKTRELSANNCKEIKEALSTDCTVSPQSGVYWVQGQQVNYIQQ